MLYNTNYLTGLSNKILTHKQWDFVINYFIYKVDVLFIYLSNKILTNKQCLMFSRFSTKLQKSDADCCGPTPSYHAECLVRWLLLLGFHVLSSLGLLRSCAPQQCLTPKSRGSERMGCTSKCYVRKWNRCRPEWQQDSGVRHSNSNDERLEQQCWSWRMLQSPAIMVATA